MTELSPERAKFCREFIKNGTVKAAAKACSVSEMTGYRWLKRDEVKAEVRKQREQRMFALNARLGSVDEASIQTITEIMHDAETNPQTRLQAAMFLLKFSSDRYDADDLQKRIENLEKIQAQMEANS